MHRPRRDMERGPGHARLVAPAPVPGTEQLFAVPLFGRLPGRAKRARSLQRGRWLPPGLPALRRLHVRVQSRRGGAVQEVRGPGAEQRCGWARGVGNVGVPRFPRLVDRRQTGRILPDLGRGQENLHFLSPVGLLSSTMNIPWPANYLSLFRFQSLVSSAGEEFVDLRCTIGDVPIAYVEYGKAAAYAALPFGLVLASFLVWSTCGRCCVQKEKRNAMMTGTITLLLYLVYPSITGKALGIWKCRTVPGVGSIFVVDPETLCTDDLHQIVTYGLALPMVLGYVVGLPVLARYLLYKFRAKLDEPNTRARFGLLYEGFRREAYLHETWVILRKVLIIVVGTFFSEKLQVLFALGIVGVLLTHTVMARPFEEENLTRLETMLLCCCFLTLWVGGIFVVYPECGSSEDYARVLCHGMEGWSLP